MSEYDARLVGRRIFLIGVLVVAACVAGWVIISEQRQEAARLAQDAEQKREQQRVEAAWSSRLELARQLATSVDLNSNLFQCYVTGSNATPARATGDPRADLLLTVAEQPLIVLYAPGFNFATHRGPDSFDTIGGSFAAHIAIARAQPGGSAAC